MEHNMILTDEEQKLFFSIYYPLLFYYNGYFKVFKNITNFNDMFDGSSLFSMGSI